MQERRLGSREEGKEVGQTYQGDCPIGSVLERRVGELTLIPIVIDPPHRQLPRLVGA